MKGGRTPIHIMRWAPADYEGDEAVKLALRRRNYRALAFYTAFINHSFMAGGDLPADPERIAATIGWRLGDVRLALRYWLDEGKLIASEGRIVQKRVAREVVEELEYRELQSERGKQGGRPKKADAKRVVLEPESPPAPAPAPSPAPAPAPPPAPYEPAGKEPATEAQRREVLKLLEEGAGAAWGQGRDGEQLLAAASATSNGRCITNIYGPRVSGVWVEATRQRLLEMRATHGARASPPPSERAQQRSAQMRAAMLGGLKGDGTVPMEGAGDAGRGLGEGLGRVDRSLPGPGRSE